MYISETSKHRHRTMKYCLGNGVDLGSGNDPIVPTALQIDLPHNYAKCDSESGIPIQFRGNAKNLYWFQDGVLDYVYSSHLIEDFTAVEQEALLREWRRVLKCFGLLVVLAPEKHRWAEALKRGQPPNLAHKHEPEVGEFTKVVERIGGFHVVEDDLCEPDNPLEYGLIFVAWKL